MYMLVCTRYFLYSAKHAKVKIFNDKRLPFSLLVGMTFKEFYKLDGEYEK